MRDGSKLLIHNTKIISNGPIYTSGSYGVFIGYLDTETRKNDVPHYLIINLRYDVIESSSANLMDARGQCQYLNQSLEAQELLLQKGELLFPEEAKNDKTSWN
jgi:hypothetical protein